MYAELSTTRTNKMSSASLPVKISLGLVTLISALELALVTATVGYLAIIEKQTFAVTTTTTATGAQAQTTVQVPGVPATLDVNQGHTSNGAAGTGFVIVGCAGLLALWLRGRPGYYRRRGAGGWLGRAWYRLWLALQVPALLLTLGALAYVFAVTNAHGGQSVDLGVVQDLRGAAKYPLGEWTPQGWFAALAALDFVSESDRDGVVSHLKIARGWQYNLIPFFLAQLAQTVLTLLDARRRRRAEGQYSPAGPGLEQGGIYEGK